MTRPQIAHISIALTGIVLWGLFPIFWKQLIHVNPLEVLAHRVIWAVPFLAALLIFSVSYKQLLNASKPWQKVIPLLGSAIMITCNWGLYIWAMGENKVVEASMGYFLAPLINVCFGVLFFKENLHKTQWIAIFLAALAVIGLFIARDVAPWLALYLAVSFAAYSAIRKMADQDAMVGLFIETLIILPFALAFVIYKIHEGSSAEYFTDQNTTLLLGTAGIVTVLPLWLWVSGCRKIKLSTAGLLFYLTPTIQFLIGIFIYKEPMPIIDLIAFIIIWIALSIYALHSYRTPSTTI